MLDDDLYKVNMGSVVFHDFPNAVVTYKFILRSKVPFPDRFCIHLHNQIQMLSKLTMTNEEHAWMRRAIPYQRPTYLEWFRHFQMDPNEVKVSQVGGELSIEICGYWFRTIYWEVKLMAIISELYFRMTEQKGTSGWMDKIYIKAKKLEDAGCHWIDFGTRRRFSFGVQNELVRIMRDYKGFLGTSNPHFAMKYGVNPHGTYAHECIMAMAALYGPRMADKMWRKHWAEHFHGNVGVALTDTFTSEVFWRDFDTYDARLFDGCRQDSGDEYVWGNNMVAHYERLGIEMSNKRMVFSNNLNTDKYIAIDRYFRQFAQPCGGIGTHFTNDVGVTPLNMVIKLATADFGHGSLGVVKLSDDPGKHTGLSEDAELVKRELGILILTTK
jgi:nicotinate phosphoribosyltransferase